MRISPIASFVFATLVLSSSTTACTVIAASGPAPEPDSGAPDASAEATAPSPSPSTCEAGVPLSLEAALPAGSELLVAWERTDGSFFVERRVGTTAPYTVATGSIAPPTEARVAPSAPWLAVGRVVAAPSGVVPSGAVDGDVLRKAVVGATFDDTLVWSAGAVSGGVEGWAARANAGFSVWKCRGSGPKSEALVESTCDALRLSVGPAGNGDRFCDWH